MRAIGTLVLAIALAAIAGEAQAQTLTSHRPERVRSVLGLLLAARRILE